MKKEKPEISPVENETIATLIPFVVGILMPVLAIHAPEPKHSALLGIASVSLATAYAYFERLVVERAIKQKTDRINFKKADWINGVVVSAFHFITLRATYRPDLVLMSGALLHVLGKYYLLPPMLEQKIDKQQKQ